MKLSKIFLITFICCASPAVYGLDIESTYPVDKTIGVPVNITITVTFNASLPDPEDWLGSVSDYIFFEKIKDKNGNTLDPATPITINWSGVSFSSANKTLNIQPSTSLDKGPTFKVTLTTLIKDTSGYALASPYSFTFNTIWGSSVNNTTVGADGKVKLYAPFNTLPADGYIEIIEDPLTNTVISTPANLRSANDAIQSSSDPLRYPLTSTMKEFNLYEGNVYSKTFLSDTQLNPNAASELPAVTLSYSDTDNDGIIDGTSPQVLEANVSIYRLNTQSNVWEKIGGTVDTQNNTITAQTNRLTVFVLMGGVYQDLNQAYGYPVPFTPHKDPSHTHITFTRLKPESTIKIYTIAGELVKELRADSLGSNVRWDTRNDTGKKVVSGLYLYRISTPSTDKTGKLIIIR